ncbi:Poly(A+) RNA-binding protein, involved in the export of mRNAs from the nucleus to the cytoplasm [Komagataella phaffii GS115]|uniref:Poly(A+) RNA-binding protein, involved in the export of mRNAs from the nucleus to the cytoplasm n=1 Tax=Komagataella phaffii (strain GS115 / ATCC 20864) TaxID=644223 RepID=C4QX56_KOMPG|nr:Poly(A+) RNA-binding protein, involved in the export of mRNAs from the nucleus to the cytoplasm [Komagataella phaffii GS115]AOA60424.1 GQ67_02194T0 [Komagataella phaffii]AOA65606.1 GQ68_02209T0 [Komagataella phaffii GS115]CAY67829.1 Poly(A+) RNA-binding protein, involved in the export of mRNAs from the nucleus to the cytoplasm [Komagataella phaffii GS115]
MPDEMDIDDYSRVSHSYITGSNPLHFSLTNKDRNSSPRRDERDRSPTRDAASDPTFSTNAYSKFRRQPERESYRVRLNSNRDRRVGIENYRDREFKAHTGGPPGRDFKMKSDRDYTKGVFIGNLPFQCSWQQLKDHFSSIGEVHRADIVTERGRSRGMGTVEFVNEEDVKLAIEKLDHTIFLDREIFVRQDYPPPDKNRVFETRPRRDTPENRDYREPPRDGTEIFVGNLPFRTQRKDLADLFGRFGGIDYVDIRLDRLGRSKGFGTVVFKKPEDSAIALKELQGFQLDGRKLDLREGVGSRRRDRTTRETTYPLRKTLRLNERIYANGPPSSTIFISNLPWATTDDDLYELVESIGPAKRAEIQLDENGRSSGNGIVEFTDSLTAESAITKLDNYNYGNRDLCLSYASFYSGNRPLKDDAELSDIKDDVRHSRSLEDSEVETDG